MTGNGPDLDSPASEMTLRVWLKDGRTLDIDIDNPAQVNYEIQARREGWPDPADGGPLLWLTNLAYWQLCEQGELEKATTEAKQWERFRNSDLRKVRQLRAPGLDAVDPTPEGHDPVPSSPSHLPPASTSTDSTEQPQSS